jgi:hypothetical protein
LRQNQNMKLSLFPSVGVVALAALLATGCTTTNGGGGSGGGGRAATEALVSAYNGAAADQLALVTSVVAQVKAGAYKDAAATLTKLQSIPGLTAAQENAVKALLTSLTAK